MSNDWIEHDGGPQEVADDVWVELRDDHVPFDIHLAKWVVWGHAPQYRILNQHLIDAKQAEIDQLKAKIVALQREVRLLGAACEWNRKFGALVQSGMPGVELARLEGIRLGLDAAANVAFQNFDWPHPVFKSIRNLNPDTIAREAQDMGSEKEAKDV